MTDLRNAFDALLKKSSQFRDRRLGLEWDKVDRFMADITDAWEKLTADDDKTAHL